MALITFSPSTTIKSADVNANFTSLQTSITNLPKEIHIPFYNNYSGFSNTSYATADQSRVTVNFANLITGLSAAFWSATMNYSTGSPTVFCQLYNVTDGAAIAGSEVSGSTAGALEFVSGDIKANLPSVSRTMAYQIKTSASTASIQAARLILRY